MKPNYYRDVWILGPASSSCPGSFPKGFISALKRKWWGQRRLWVCSGGFKDSGGVMLDIRREMMPTVLADAQELPFKDASFDFVMADPPYSEAEAGDLYGLPYLRISRLLTEMIRVAEPRANIALLHRLIPSLNDGQVGAPMQQLELEAVVGIGTLAAWTNIRALTIWRKRQPLETFDGHTVGSRR